MRREYPDPKNPGHWKLSEKPGNAYFHAHDLACLCRVQELSNINETHIYIKDGIYQSDSRPLGVTRTSRALKCFEENTSRTNEEE